MERLIENFVIEPKDYSKKPLTESIIKVNENGKDVEYKARGVYTFPISRPGKENLNGRVYGNDLWEKVIKEKQAENGYGLMDHPEEEGSTKDVWCVWRNKRFNEDKSLILADAYLVGKYGQEVLERLEAGGKIGLSTSGFGEFLEDGKTINPKTFMLERVADYVLNPSYEVFGTEECRVDNKKESVDINKKENKNMSESVAENASVKPNTLNEKALLFNIKSMFKEAMKETSISKRILLCKNIVESITDDMTWAKELKDEILSMIEKDEKEIAKRSDESDDKDAKIKELEAKVKELEDKLADKDKESDEKKKDADKDKEEKEKLKKEKESLEKSLKNATELLDSMKVYSKKQEELYKTAEAEKNAMVTAKEYNESLKYAQSLQEENDDLKQQIVDLMEKKSCKEDDDNDADDEVCPNCGKELDDCDCEESKKSKKKESAKNPDVYKYYEDLYARNPKVEKIKEDILKCKTLMEAERTYIRLKGIIYENVNSMVNRMDEESVYGYGRKNSSSVKKSNMNIREGWL